MKSRRSFLNQVGKVSALSALAMSTPIPLISSLTPRLHSTLKPFVIGIIGAENSHTAGFGSCSISKKHFREWK